MMKILLTGSSGYLGSKFIELFGRDYEILGLSRASKDLVFDLLDTKRVFDVSANFNPDFIVHTAAMVGRDKGHENIFDIHVQIMNTLIQCAKVSSSKFVLTSSESIYGGKELIGGYVESDAPKPRHEYGRSKLECERLLQESGLTYLITRSGRFVGFNKGYNREKQFPDTLKALLNIQPVKLDSDKPFSYAIIDNLAASIAYYIENDSDNSRLLYISASDVSTYFDLISKIATQLNITSGLVQPGGCEEGWLPNSAIDSSLSAQLGYPKLALDELVDIVSRDYLAYSGSLLPEIER